MFVNIKTKYTKAKFTHKTKTKLKIAVLIQIKVCFSKPQNKDLQSNF